MTSSKPHHTEVGVIQKAFNKKLRNKSPRRRIIIAAGGLSVERRGVRGWGCPPSSARDGLAADG